MKKRYYLSMLGLFLIVVAFNSIYLVYHKSLAIFFGLGGVHFILYVLLNYVGCYFIYKPIDGLFIAGKETEETKIRIDRLSWYSSLWIFFIGNIYVAITLLPLYFFPTIFKNPEDFVVEQIPPEFFFLSILPAIYFIYALFPSPGRCISFTTTARSRGPRSPASLLSPILMSSRNGGSRTLRFIASGSTPCSLTCSTIAGTE